MIAFLGTGLLGSGFIRAALKRGESVQVFNRTAAKAKTLEADGAKAFDNPADAVRGAQRIHLALSDDRAVDAVLELALPGIAKDAEIVDHTTTSASGVRARVERLAKLGFEFQHAPVFMGPQNALEATGMMLVSGDAARIDRLRPALEKMTGKLVNLGTEPDRAAQFKLFGNMYLLFLNSCAADVLTLGKAFGLSPADTATIFDVFNPGAAITPRVNRVLAADYANPTWELAMARKDARLMIEEAERGGAPLNVVPAIAGLMDRYIERGHANDDWTVIAKDAIDR